MAKQVCQRPRRPKRIKTDLGIDSLKAITILYQLEDRFDIEIPNELIEKIVTIGDIVTNIDRLRENSDTQCHDM